VQILDVPEMGISISKCRVLGRQSTAVLIARVGANEPSGSGTNEEAAALQLREDGLAGLRVAGAGSG
jgi:hypothetical protein